MYSYKKPNGKAMGTGDWSAENEESGSLTYTGLWKDGRVVALLVSKEEDEDQEFGDMAKRLYSIGDEIVTACNAHAGLVEALKKMVELMNDGFNLEAGCIAHVEAREALTAAGVK